MTFVLVVAFADTITPLRRGSVGHLAEDEYSVARFIGLSSVGVKPLHQRRTDANRCAPLPRWCAIKAGGSRSPADISLGLHRHRSGHWRDVRSHPVCIVRFDAFTSLALSPTDPQASVLSSQKNEVFEGG